MKAFIITTILGCFGASEEKKIVEFIPFPKNPLKIAERLKDAKEKIIPEEKELVKRLRRKGYDEIIFSVKKEGVEKFKVGSEVEEYIRSNLSKIALEKKLIKDEGELRELVKDVNIALSKIQIKEKIGKDALVVQVIRGMEEVDKTINLFVERLREWYGLHFPEMNQIITDHEKFAKIVKDFGSRKNIKSVELLPIIEESMGKDFEEEDIEMIQYFAGNVLRLFKLREKMEDYLQKVLKEVAPNLTELAGPMIAAKLISRAGSLEKLAKMPASTIQLLGAEKALFRFLHGKGKSPRFGIIFGHPYIQQAPEKLKGRVARALASKLTIAVKMDFYSKEYKADKLKKELEERVKEILKEKVKRSK